MRKVTETNGIEFGLLDDADYAEMVALLATAFSQREPPAMAAGLTTQDLEILVNIFRSKALEEDVSIVARTRAGQLVGALLAEDFGTPPPASLNAAPERFAPIGALLDSIDDEYRKAHSVVPGSHVHLFMIAVAASHLRQGVAQTMIMCCLENGIARGYRMAVVEAAGLVSQHMFRNAGFRDFCLGSYKDFVYEGRRPFASIAAQGGTLFMDRSIGTA